MKNYKCFLRQDVKCAFQEKFFWISMLLLLAILFHGMIMYTNMDASTGTSTYVYIVNAMALSGFGPFAAVFPSMGYSVRFCEEYNSGYFQMIRSRISWKKYASARMVSVGLSGGMIVAIPIMIVCIFAYIKGVPGVPQDGFLQGLQVVEYIEKYGDLFVLSFKVLLGFLFGVMFSLVGLAFAVWSCNRYVTVIAPFVLYEAMWVVFYRYPMFNPIYLYRGDDLDSYPLSAFMEILYIAITALIIWFGFRKKANDE